METKCKNCESGLKKITETKLDSTREIPQRAVYYSCTTDSTHIHRSLKDIFFGEEIIKITESEPQIYQGKLTLQVIQKYASQTRGKLSPWEEKNIMERFNKAN